MRIKKEKAQELFTKTKLLQQAGLRPKDAVDILSIGKSTASRWFKHSTYADAVMEQNKSVAKSKERKLAKQVLHTEPIKFKEPVVTHAISDSDELQAKRFEAGKKMISYQVATLQEVRATNKLLEQLVIKMTELVEATNQRSDNSGLFGFGKK